MGQLESTMETISGASDSVNSSLSERRAQLEGLNGVKSNLAKLQLLMDLPPRLQACVEAKQYEEAVRHHRRAQRLLKAVGHVASFDSIRAEAAAIMQRLTQTLKAKLDDPALPPAELGSTTRLLLLLEGHEAGKEAELLRDYLHRRRRALHEQLASFTPEAADANTARLSTEGDLAADADAAAHGGPEAAEGQEGGGNPADDLDAISAASSASSSFVTQLGRSFVPCLVRLQHDWTAMVAGPEAGAAAAEAAGAAGAAEAAGAAAGGLSAAEKQAMLLETLQELAGGYLEMCRRQLDGEEDFAPPAQHGAHKPAQLLAGIQSLLGSLSPLDEIAPQVRVRVGVRVRASHP